MRAQVKVIAVALLAFAGCDGNSFKTSPTEPPPVPPPPAVTLSGTWTGTVSETGIPGDPDFPDCAEPVTANFTQSGASVEGTLKDSSYSNCFGVYIPTFRGTLEGRNLGGVIHFLGGDPGVAASGQVEGDRDDRLTITTLTGLRTVWDLRR